MRRALVYGLAAVAAAAAGLGLWQPLDQAERASLGAELVSAVQGLEPVRAERPALFQPGALLVVPAPTRFCFSVRRTDRPRILERLLDVLAALGLRDVRRGDEAPADDAGLLARGRAAGVPYVLSVAARREQAAVRIRLRLIDVDEGRAWSSEGNVAAEAVRRTNPALLWLIALVPAAALVIAARRPRARARPLTSPGDRVLVVLAPRGQDGPPKAP